MEKRKKLKNKWKIATLVMLLFMFGIIGYNIILANQNYKITNDKGLSFEITKANYDKAIKILNVHSNLYGNGTYIVDNVHKTGIASFPLK